MDKNKTIIILVAAFLLFSLIIICCIIAFFGFNEFIYNEKQGESTDNQDSPIIDNKTDKILQTEIWDTLLSQRNTSCEEVLPNPRPELEKYPYIELPKEGEYIAVTSLRNLQASSYSVDIVNSKSEIVTTLYFVDDFKFSPDGKQVLFSGYSEDDCNEKKIAIYDLDSNTLSKELNPFSETEYDQSSTNISMSWSQDGNYITLGIVTPYLDNGYGKYIVRTYNTNGNLYNETILVGDQFFFPPCGSICISPNVKYNQFNNTYLVADLIFYKSSKNEFILKQFSSDGTLQENYNIDLSGDNVGQTFDYGVIDETSLGIDSTSENTCERVEYKSGGVSAFCSQNTKWENASYEEIIKVKSD